MRVRGRVPGNGMGGFKPPDPVPSPQSPVRFPHPLGPKVVARGSQVVSSQGHVPKRWRHRCLRVQDQVRVAVSRWA